MFDFSRIADAVGAFTAGSAAESEPAGLMQQLAEIGVDPAALQGLAPQEIVDLLAQHGIDIANLDAAQLTEIAGQIGASDVVASAGQWLSDRLLRS